MKKREGELAAGSEKGYLRSFRLYFGEGGGGGGSPTSFKRVQIEQGESWKAVME